MAAGTCVGQQHGCLPQALRLVQLGGGTGCAPVRISLLACRMSRPTALLPTHFAAAHSFRPAAACFLCRCGPCVFPRSRGGHPPGCGPCGCCAAARLAVPLEPLLPRCCLLMSIQLRCCCPCAVSLPIASGPPTHPPTPLDAGHLELRPDAKAPGYPAAYLSDNIVKARDGLVRAVGCCRALGWSSGAQAGCRVCVTRLGWWHGALRVGQGHHPQPDCACCRWRVAALKSIAP